MLIELPVSTTTVTPVVPEQAAALAGAATTTSPAMARPEAATAPARRATNRSAGRRIRRAPPDGAARAQTGQATDEHEQQAEQGRRQQVGAGLRERAVALESTGVDGSEPPAPSVGALVVVGSTVEVGVVVGRWRTASGSVAGGSPPSGSVDARAATAARQARGSACGVAEGRWSLGDGVVERVGRREKARPPRKGRRDAAVVLQG